MGRHEAVKPTVPKNSRRSALKNTPEKESWQALRERYTWHLRPPFKDQFDRSHWWKGKQVAKQRPALLPRFVLGKSAPAAFAARLWHVAVEIDPALLSARLQAPGGFTRG